MLTADETFEPDRGRPASHLITGIVLRALAAHPRYRHSACTLRAAELLKSRFFRRDVYPDRAAPSNWLIFRGLQQTIGSRPGNPCRLRWEARTGDIGWRDGPDGGDQPNR